MKRKPTEREIEIRRTLLLLEITKGKKDKQALEERTKLYRKLASLGYGFQDEENQRYETR